MKDDERRAGRLGAEIVGRIQRHPAWRNAGDFLFGLFLYDTVRQLRRQRGELESLFVLALFGDLVGVPILPPYYALRLLPYTVPSIQNWKNRLLRERDLTDLIG